MTLRYFLYGAFTALAMLALPAAADSGAVVRYAVEGKFQNVFDDVVNAIVARGLVIDHTAHVAKMLDRTGGSVGSTRKLFGRDQGQVLSFCSAVVSRLTMEADPHNLVFCPYSIAVYTTLNEPTRVYVAYRRPERPDGNPASRAALKEVEALLDGIAREALGLPARSAHPD
jgi:uncharacterized protein (DUF302 family)